MTETARTVKEILTASAAFLKGRTDEPGPNVEYLLCALLNCKRSQLPLKYDGMLQEKHVEAMRRGVRRLAAGEPAQYITGITEFMGRNFKSDQRALIPRPETEELVRHALSAQELWTRPKPAVLDIGTGSGIIIISLASEKKGPVFVGHDTSGEALELAKENASAICPDNEIFFVSGDLSDLFDPASFDMIVSNPPYIPSSDIGKLPPHIRNFEPSSALDGGRDGLDVLTSIIQDSAILLKPQSHLLLEIGYNQAAAVKDLLTAERFEDITVFKDLSGHDRVVSATTAA